MGKAAVKPKDDEIDETEEGAEEEAPELTKDQKKKLFEDYSAALDDANVAQKALEEANEAKSETVRAIQKACGNGPFEFGGQKLIVMRRGTTYYFRGESTSKIEKID